MLTGATSAGDTAFQCGLSQNDRASRKQSQACLSYAEAQPINAKHNDAAKGRSPKAAGHAPVAWPFGLRRPFGRRIPPGLHRGMAEYFSKKRLPWIMRKACKSANMKNTCPYKSVKNALWQRTIGQVSPEWAHLSTKTLRECSQAGFTWTGLFRAVMQGVIYSLNQKSPSTFIGLEWSCEADWRGS